MPAGCFALPSLHSILLSFSVILTTFATDGAVDNGIRTATLKT